MTSIHEAAHGRRHRWRTSTHGWVWPSSSRRGSGEPRLTAIVILAIGVGLVAATSFLASANRGGLVPTADHRYDQIENLRGAATFAAGPTAFRLPQSAFPASAHDYQLAVKARDRAGDRVPPAAVGLPGLGRDYQSASKPEIAPATAFRLPQSAFPASARDYQSASKPEIAPATLVAAGGVLEP